MRARCSRARPTRELFARPGNPYTKGLLLSVPDPTREDGEELYQIPGLPPDVAHLPPGCPFAPRCDARRGHLPRAVPAVRRADARPSLAVSFRARGLRAGAL